MLLMSTFKTVLSITNILGEYHIHVVQTDQVLQIKEKIQFVHALLNGT